MVTVDGVCAALGELAGMAVEARVAAYNQIVAAAAELVADVSPDPAAAPRIVAIDAIDANDYNPNHVAGPEMDLLRQSIEADGVTMGVVVVESGGRYTVVDGFHRTSVLRDQIGREYVPCAVLASPMGDRMASTVRHNRARGKHGVELMAALVREMEGLDWDGERIADALGMAPEELLRLRQMMGAARSMASGEFSQSWGTIEP